MSAGVPAGPLESDPGGFLPGEERSAILAGVLEGVEMGSWDLRVVGWLSGLDTSTALTVASLIARARETGPGRAGGHDHGAGCGLLPAAGHYL